MNTNCKFEVSHMVFWFFGFVLVGASIASDANRPSKIGNFSFLENPNENYMVYYRHDVVKINCSTTYTSATSILIVTDIHDVTKNIKDNTLFNNTLRKIGHDFTFVADPHQTHISLSCKAQSGSYVIWAKRGTLIIRNEIRILPVKLTPNITEITVEKASSFEIECRAEGHGNAYSSYIKWFKTKSIGSFAVDQRFVNRRGTGGVDIEVLSLRNITEQMQGVYKCQRKVATGPPTSASFRLIVKDAQKPLVSLDAKSGSISVLEHKKSTVLTCRVILGSPRPTIAWYKANRRIKLCSRNTSCLLEIVDVKCPDDEGNYTCTAINTEGSNSVSVHLTVLVPVSLEKPRYTTKVYAKLAPYNENAELQCIVRRANPLPRIIWRYKPLKCNKTSCNGYGGGWTSHFTKVAMKPGPSVPTNASKLILPPSTIAAFYSCQAINEAGTDFLNLTLQRTAVNVHTTKNGLNKDSNALKSPGKANSTVILVAVSCSVIAILLVLLLAYGYKRRLQNKYALYLRPYSNFVLDQKLTINEQSHRLPYDPKWEFPRDKLHLIEPIGRGAFGEVWLAQAQGILEFNATTGNISPVKKKRMSRAFSFTSNYHKLEMLQNAGKTTVAVKTLKDNANDTDYKDLASELKILIQIGEHQNIVNLLGACTRAGKLMVILEYCPHGDLSNFLRGKRDIFEPSWIKADYSFEQACTYFDLANITYQIARGMDYLSSKKCIHRDLAARNILVSKDHNQDYIIKIADFGMARDIYKEGIYTKESSGVLPLKWTAPESLADAIYTSQSDVWSFGVVLWEIFTLGGSPYPGIATDEFIPYLKANRRMEKPECCPDEFYDLMRNCWDEEPNERPTFSKLFELIADIIESLTDTNATYLRLESGDCKPENEFPAKEQETIGAVNASLDTTVIDESVVLVDLENGKQPSCNGYENLQVVLGTKTEPEDRVDDEYVPMVNGPVNDENENVLPNS